MTGTATQTGIRARYAYQLDPLGFLAGQRELLGDIFALDEPRVVVCDPSLVHEVLAKTGADYHAGHDALHRFVREDPERVASWMHGRRVAWQGVNSSMLARHGRRLDGSLGRAVDEWSGPEFGVLASAQDLMARAALDFCICRDNDDLAEAVAAASRAQLAVQDRVAGRPLWLPSRTVHRGRRADRRMREAIDACVERRGRSPVSPPEDLLDVLEADGSFTDDELARTLKRTLVGSHGVPGAALSWLIRDVGSRPEVAAAVRREHSGYSQAVTSGTTESLPYTEAVVKEVLRLHPPVWMMMREVVAETTLGPMELSPGRQVLLPVALIHRDPRHWTDPEEFRPQRWLGSEQPHSRYAYLPFGSGPRMCLGYRLGSFELALAIHRLLAAADIELVGTDAGAPTFGAILTPAKLVARLRRPQRAGRA